MGYEDNRRIADKYIPALKNILLQNAMKLISIDISSDEQDTKYATDLVMCVKGGDVATRVRNPTCVYRDFTVRSRTKYTEHGTETEIHKLKRGFARWYLYAWTNDIPQIDSWVLIDLDIVRQHRLLDKDRREIPNGDGTWFIPITINELYEHDCIISHNNIFTTSNNTDKKQTTIFEW